jgi:hypothetical protein
VTIIVLNNVRRKAFEMIIFGLIIWKKNGQQRKHDRTIIIIPLTHIIKEELFVTY